MSPQAPIPHFQHRFLDLALQGSEDNPIEPLAGSLSYLLRHFRYRSGAARGHSAYKEGLFLGYRHFDKTGIAPLFPFGYGLSYMTFKYRT